MALELGLDLVEVDPKARPPICKIQDYGKLQYRAKKSAKPSDRTIAKIVKLAPDTQEHDLEVKAKAAQKFLTAGHRVKVLVRMSKPEAERAPQIAQRQLETFLRRVGGRLIQKPSRESFKVMTALVAPV